MAAPWHPLTPASLRALPAALRPWAALDASMTEAVGRAGGGPVEVELIRQGPGRLLPDEAAWLPGAARGRGTVREVCLRVRGRPLLLARTAFASRALAEHPTVRDLGGRPLGSLLFAGPRPAPVISREVALLGPRHPLHALARRRGGPARGLWARRSLVLLLGTPILVTEALLPDLLGRSPEG